VWFSATLFRTCRNFSNDVRLPMKDDLEFLAADSTKERLAVSRTTTHHINDMTVVGATTASGNVKYSPADARSA
jgi:hypothetical protein